MAEMSNPSFVGFQAKVEIPEGFELLEIREEIVSALDKEELYSYLSRADLLSNWFYEVKNLDLRPGGKVNFIDDSGSAAKAVCTSVTFGKNISLLADAFGNFTAHVSKSGSGSKISLNFKILTDSPQVNNQRILAAISKLRALIA